MKKLIRNNGLIMLSSRGFPGEKFISFVRFIEDFAHQITNCFFAFIEFGSRTTIRFMIFGMQSTGEFFEDGETIFLAFYQNMWIFDPVAMTSLLCSNAYEAFGT